MDTVKMFLLCIIPIMVAIDAPGVLPVYISATENMEEREKKRIAKQSVFTAFLIAIFFIFLGTAVFNMLGIRVEDFMIAGGVLLLVISIDDLLRAGTKRITATHALGVVPLGTPLLAGPATLTTSLVLAGDYGYLPVILALVLNLFLAWLIFDRADAVIRRIGINGARGIAKLASLLLAAIAVKMIRTGIFKLIEQ